MEVVYVSSTMLHQLDPPTTTSSVSSSNFAPCPMLPISRTPLSSSTKSIPKTHLSIHECVKKRKVLESDVFVGTALVDMYAKCGFIDMALEVFEWMPKRIVFSWAAIMGGFAVYGYAREAIHFLEQMQVEDGLRPDGVVLLGVLIACTHAGLKKEGKFMLDNMEFEYGVLPPRALQLHGGLALQGWSIKCSSY